MRRWSDGQVTIGADGKPLPRESRAPPPPPATDSDESAAALRRNALGVGSLFRAASQAEVEPRDRLAGLDRSESSTFEPDLARTIALCLRSLAPAAHICDMQPGPHGSEPIKSENWVTPAWVLCTF